MICASVAQADNEKLAKDLFNQLLRKKVYYSHFILIISTSVFGFVFIQLHQGLARMLHLTVFDKISL